MLSGVGAFLDEVLGLTAQQRTVVFRAAWVSTLTVHILWACGWFTAFGLSGFARADELREHAQFLSRIEIQLLEKAMFDTRVTQCRATQKQVYAERLQEMLTRHREAAGVGYQLPSCADVL